MKTKAKGTRIEHKCIADLEKVGYTCFRCAGSFSPVDVIAINNTGIRLIQVKSETAERPLRPSEIEAASEPLAALPHPVGVSCELWIWRTGKGWIRQVPLDSG